MRLLTVYIGDQPKNNWWVKDDPGQVSVTLDGQVLIEADEFPDKLLAEEPEAIGSQVRGISQTAVSDQYTIWTKIGPNQWTSVRLNGNGTTPYFSAWPNLAIFEVISPKEEPKVLTEQEEPTGVGAVVSAICLTCKASDRNEDQYFIRHRFTNTARWVCDCCGVTNTWGQLKGQLTGYIHKGLAAGDEQSPKD